MFSQKKKWDQMGLKINKVKKGRSWVWPLVLFFLQYIRFFLFLPFFSCFSPFFIKLNLQIYHQEFGTDCLGLVFKTSSFCFIVAGSFFIFLDSSNLFWQRISLSFCNTRFGWIFLCRSHSTISSRHSFLIASWVVPGAFVQFTERNIIGRLTREYLNCFSGSVGKLLSNTCSFP